MIIKKQSKQVARGIVGLLLALLCALISPGIAAEAPVQVEIKKPEAAPIENGTLEFFGKKIRDPYLWMKKGNDSKTFFYSRLQKLDKNSPPQAVYENEKVFLHKIGSDPEKDPAVFGSTVLPELSLPEAGSGSGCL